MGMFALSPSKARRYFFQSTTWPWAFSGSVQSIARYASSTRGLSSQSELGWKVRTFESRKRNVKLVQTSPYSHIRGIPKKYRQSVWLCLVFLLHTTSAQLLLPLPLQGKLVWRTTWIQKFHSGVSRFLNLETWDSRFIVCLCLINNSQLKSQVWGSGWTIGFSSWSQQKFEGFQHQPFMCPHVLAKRPNKYKQATRELVTERA